MTPLRPPRDGARRRVSPESTPETTPSAGGGLTASASPPSRPAPIWYTERRRFRSHVWLLDEPGAQPMHIAWFFNHDDAENVVKHLKLAYAFGRVDAKNAAQRD